MQVAVAIWLCQRQTLFIFSILYSYRSTFSCAFVFLLKKKEEYSCFSLYAVTTRRNGEITTKWKLSVEEMEIKYGEKMVGWWWWCDVMIKWAAELSSEWAKLLWLLPSVSFGFMLLMMTITMMIATNKINYGMPHRKRRLAGWAMLMLGWEGRDVSEGNCLLLA